MQLTFSMAYSMHSTWNAPKSRERERERDVVGPSASASSDETCSTKFFWTIKTKRKNNNRKCKCPRTFLDIKGNQNGIVISGSSPLAVISSSSSSQLIFVCVILLLFSFFAFVHFNCTSMRWMASSFSLLEFFRRLFFFRFRFCCLSFCTLYFSSTHNGMEKCGVLFLFMFFFVPSLLASPLANSSSGSRAIIISRI